MGSKTRLSSYCTKRGDDTVNLVTSRKTNARLARPILTHIPARRDLLLASWPRNLWDVYSCPWAGLADLPAPHPPSAANGSSTAAKENKEKIVSS